MYVSLEDLGIPFDKVNKNGETPWTCINCSHTRKKSKVKCLSYNHSDGVFRCNHCGFSGTTKQMTEKKDYKKPTPIDTHLPQPVVNWFEQERGLKPATLRYFKITATTRWFPQTGKEEKCISFPYFFNGEVVNYKHRTKDKDFVMEKGAMKTLCNIDNIDDDFDYVVITEGEIDLYSVHQSGVTQVVSIPNGATKGVNNLEYFDPHYDKLKSKKKIIIATDNDEAGMYLRDDIADRFGRDICVYVDFGDCKDANEYLIKHGEGKLKDLILKGYKQFPIKGIYDLDDNKEKIINRQVSDHVNYGMGWQKSDEHLKIAFGEWTVVTGAPNSGKSELVESILIHMTKKGFRCAMFVPESMPVEEHYERIAMKILENPNPLPEEKEQLFETIKEYFVWIEDDVTVVKLDELLSIFKQLVVQYGVKFFYIDPFNFLDDAYDFKALGRSLTKITQFVKNHNVHVFLVAHPKKPARGKNGEIVDFTLYDISGTADWYNKTYNGMIVKRMYGTKSPVGTDMVQVDFAKVKRRLNGTAGGFMNLYPDFKRGGILRDDYDMPDEQEFLGGNFKPLID